MERYFKSAELDELKDKLPDLKKRVLAFNKEDIDNDEVYVYPETAYRQCQLNIKRLANDIKLLNKAIKVFEPKDAGLAITPSVIEKINADCASVLNSKPVRDREALISRLLAVAHHNELWCYDDVNEFKRDPSEIHPYRVWFESDFMYVAGSTPSNEDVTGAYVSIGQLASYMSKTPQDAHCPRASNPDIETLEID
jgi:hypothetical protein